jgi:succinate-semialdehyde dehydrogenase/glutarate-semialdehyde dehydrogenase
MSYPKLAMFIFGRWQTTQKGTAVINPADGSTVGILPHAERIDLDHAIAAAEAGFDTWRRMSPVERERIMLRAAERLEARREEIAHALVIDQGKTIREALAEVQTAVDRIIWDAAEGRRLYGRIVPSSGGLRKEVLRLPIGIVAAFTPWNYPLASPTRKVAGALAAGCSIILKASEETPAGAVELVRAFAEAGVPDGVVNLVFGNPADISAYLIPQPAVRLVTFTGSVAVGKHLASLCGQYMKPAIMELGGNSPVIVWSDADPSVAAAASVNGKARNAGQVCVSPTRFLVHEKIYDQFVAAFAKGASALRIGTGSDPSLEMGPLANRRRLDAVESYVADAVSRGASLVAGGARAGHKGFLYPLTVLADVPDDARAMVEEPFGPVALLKRVRTLDEAVASANAVGFGLAAYAFTDSASVAARLSNDIQCGSLSINHFTSTFPDLPFGGIRDSGYGREGGSEGLDGYTFTRAVTHMSTLIS